MRITRTDLALEGVEQLRQGGDISRLDGVCAAEYTRHGYGVTDVRVATKQAAEAVGKPEGRYVTIDLRPYFRREEGFFARAARCLASELRTLLPGVGEDWPVLVAGLGNRGMTADAVGPLALESLLVTRHMGDCLPRDVPMSSVCAAAPGVLGVTGMETAEILRGMVAHVKPDAVIAVDALAARSSKRIASTIQITDTGITPGSGVGNHRKALDRRTLGVPVIAVGVPLVVYASTIASDALCALGEGEVEEERIAACVERVVSEKLGEMIVTPRDVDALVERMAGVLADGINQALHPSLSSSEIAQLMAQ